MNIVGRGSKLWAAFRVWSELDFEYHDYVAPIFESDYSRIIIDNYMKNISAEFHCPPMIILERLWRT